jgi:ligand-binding sensor domain-containing protein
MWFGTPEGLCCYDGYRIITFKSDYNNPNLLTDNDITALAEDDDYIWIGAQKGVNILDKKTCIIRHFGDEVIANSEIKFIRITSDKSVWIGTTQGLFLDCFTAFIMTPFVNGMFLGEYKPYFPYLFFVP